MMSKQAEINYFRAIGPAGQQHAVGKPFSDANCSKYLVEMGAIMHLLPAPPARILDIGCGTGWTSLFLGRRGYDVTGVDISEDMIRAAETVCRAEGLEHVRFIAGDYESLPFENEFDAALFYDSLHHAVDEELAIRSAYQALRPGGVCVTSEPGSGHSRNPVTQAAVARYGVTEKDMPPTRIIAAGRKSGFRNFSVYPHAFTLSHLLYETSSADGAPRRWHAAWRLVQLLCAAPFLHSRCGGIVCLRK